MYRLTILFIAGAFLGLMCKSHPQDDPCSFSRLCKNGGKCFYDGEDYSCQCLEGFVGKNCQFKCIDSNPKQCRLWAAMNECKKNPKYMNSNCTKSCLCECSDYEVRQCPEWAKDGGCERNKDYMKAFCRRSCGLC